MPVSHLWAKNLEAAVTRLEGPFNVHCTHCRARLRPAISGLRLVTAVIAVAEGGDFAARRGGIYVFGGSLSVLVTQNSDRLRPSLSTNRKETV